jgi:hypothetical protein
MEKKHTFVLALEFLDKVVVKTVVKIFPTKMGITSGFDFENNPPQ